MKYIFTLLAVAFCLNMHAQVCFGPSVNFPAGKQSRAVISNDFNGDGLKDLAVVNGLSNDVSIFMGTGTGNFGAANNFLVESNPVSIISDDFNGDNIADLAVANGGSNSISLLLGDGTGSFANAIPFAVGVGPFFCNQC